MVFLAAARRGAPGLPGGECGMPGSAKAMAVLAVAGLVLATVYTVALGSSGWVWFAWAVLGLVTIGVLATSGTHRV